MESAFPVTWHVTCPLCGEEIGGGYRGSSDYPIDLLRGQILSDAWEHCYDHHPEAVGIVLFHVEADVARTGATRSPSGRTITKIQLEREEPVVLPVDRQIQLSIRRRRQRQLTQSELDQRFLQVVRAIGPARLGSTGAGSEAALIGWRRGN